MDEPAGFAAESDAPAAEDSTRLSDLRTVVLSTGTDQPGRIATKVVLVHKKDVGKVADLLDALKL